VYILIVQDIFVILKKEAIIDWHKNIDVKRKMINIIDDYLYDSVKGEKGIDIDSDFIKTTISTIMQLAENNFELFI
jgi:hypothetical protein